MMTNAINSARVLLVLVVSMLAIGCLTPAAARAEGQAQEKISPKLAKPMKAAQEALQKKQWDQALVKINEADAMPGKSAFDQFIINEFKTSALFALKKYAEAAPDLRAEFQFRESAAGRGQRPSQDAGAIVYAAAELAEGHRLGDRWLKAGEKDPDIQFAIAQAYYVQKDYKNSASIMQGAIKSGEQAGKSLDENWLQMVRSS